MSPPYYFMLRPCVQPSFFFRWKFHKISVCNGCEFSFHKKIAFPPVLVAISFAIRWTLEVDEAEPPRWPHGPLVIGWGLCQRLRHFFFLAGAAGVFYDLILVSIHSVGFLGLSVKDQTTPKLTGRVAVCPKTSPFHLSAASHLRGGTNQSGSVTDDFRRAGQKCADRKSEFERPPALATISHPIRKQDFALNGILLQMFLSPPPDSNKKVPKKCARISGRFAFIWNFKFGAKFLMKFPNNSNWKWNIQKVINNPIKIWKNDDRVDVIGGWQASRSTSLFFI